GRAVVARQSPRRRLPHQRPRRVEPRRHQESREGGVGLDRCGGPRDRGVPLMAIKGSLKEASLPDVLQLLALGQKTGCLSIADRSNFGYIYFEKGRICYASIVNRRDRLGDILVKHARITEEQLAAAIHRQSTARGKKLGEILVGMSVISQTDRERYMRVQIEESVYYLFTWTQGTDNFEFDVRPGQQDFLVSINPESLLREGAPQSRRGILQEGHAGRGDARVPAGGGAAPRRSAGALLHRARGAEAGTLARGDGGAAPRGRARRKSAGRAPQPRLRVRATR